jgi:hypothetical protein
MLYQFTPTSENTMSQPTQPTTLNDRDHSRLITKVDRLLAHLQKATCQFNGEPDNAGDKISVDEAIASVRSAYELARDLHDFLTPHP